MEGRLMALTADTLNLAQVIFVSKRSTAALRRVWEPDESLGLMLYPNADFTDALARG
jgi:hypothetical protein